MGNKASHEEKEKEKRVEKQPAEVKVEKEEGGAAGIPKRKAKSVSAGTSNSTTPRRHAPRNSVSSQGNRKPVLTVNQRSIIKYCLDNAKEDIADRILRRASEKKEDMRTFLDNLPRNQRSEISDCLKDFLYRVCDSLTDSEEIQKISEDFGQGHVPFRAFGFKPDFFACTADAVTTECTFLDQATHTPSETAGSWSILSAFVFSAVRDGYYAELRRQRKCSNAFRSRPSVDVSTDGSVTTENNSRRESMSSVTSWPDKEKQQSEENKDNTKENETQSSEQTLDPCPQLQMS